MSTYLRLSCVIVLFSLLPFSTPLVAQNNLSPEQLRELEHQDPQWPSIQAHLPDPATASAADLEMVGDILRARRFPEDALDYYMYAMRRGGKEVSLLNKMGIIELELWHTERARAYFLQVIKLKKKDAQGWNNLGATEYVAGRMDSAIFDYGRAIKLNKKVASYHSNLGTVYLEEKDFSGARKQFAKALSLDPELFDHRQAMGVTARMLTTDDHARFCFEMARLYADRGDVENMLHYLKMASEGGFDVLEEMNHDGALSRYRKDPRVLLIVRNARALRSNHASVQDVSGELQPLPAQRAPAERE